MKEEIIPSGFTLRSYTKAELALLYSPHNAPRTAIRKFNSWLRHSPRLWEPLRESGVSIATREYNPMQVQMIVNYLGAP
ncbi:DUF4248 domain-containing protein [Bacteroides sp. 224]|uniref:DUF4248 domain-containing protein n=1 Tax=Bacteroides sp. 224 TaxID=2302936 RepID=UPI0013CFB082|nr:DUF4248 domain-containing protein [Bacteroides sp. 224]NDV63763.1 DUF4248 domain-containing protein [Bacteroides sp. 224]